MEIHERLNQNTRETKCPNSSDGVHRGIKHNRFGDGCCTCGKYLLFDKYGSLSELDELKRDFPEQMESITT